MIKKCNVCKKNKNIEDFHYRIKNNQKYYSYKCKNCQSEYMKTYYKSNKSKIKTRTKNFKNQNPEYIKEWREKNIDKVKSQQKIWYESNKENINKKERQKRKIDPAYKIKKNLRRRVNQTITRSYKKDKTIELIGCSIYQLLQYLETKFKDGMTWNNYGKWHIDHIKPCASFDLTDTQQQKECFNYTNLQPLWADDNIRKSDKVFDNEQ
jgi:hypothetical protein